MKRVVVTGLGLLTTLGNDYRETWNNLISGHSGIKKISQFDVSDLPCKIAGFLSNNIDDENYFNKNNLIETRDIKRNDRFIQYGLAAAKMAIEDAFLSDLNEEENYHHFLYPLH